MPQCTPSTTIKKCIMKFQGTLPKYLSVWCELSGCHKLNYNHSSQKVHLGGIRDIRRKSLKNPSTFPKH
jgi:hypothetical protein